MRGRPVVGLVENVIIKGENEKNVKARIDTGATRSSIDVHLAKQIGLGPEIEKRKVKSAHGITIRSLVHATITLRGQEFEETFTLIDRGHMTYPILVGQNVLKKGKYLVDPLK